ncbi:hypothetical protein [Brevundimonas vitis]|nr:hypothetical protein [Brevundimonas vitisensis]
MWQLTAMMAGFAKAHAPAGPAKARAPTLEEHRDRVRRLTGR